MADAVSNSVQATIPSFLVGSPEDAIHVMDAVQVTVTDTIRSAIQQNVSAISRLLTTLDKTSKTCAALYSGLTSTNTAVTVASLESTPRTATDLQALFHADGPMMGANLQEADDNYDFLTSLGLTVDAPVITPVLVRVDNMDGTTPTKSFAWYGQAQLAEVKKLTDTVVSPYPGSTTYVKTVTNGSGTITQTISYTSFDSYANRRVTAAASFIYFFAMINLAVAIQLQLVEELAKAAKQADKLEDMVKDNRNTIKDEDTALSQRRTARDEQLAETLRQLRVLKAEREELRARARSKAADIGMAGGEPGMNEVYGLGNGLHIGRSMAEAVDAIRSGRPFRIGAELRNGRESEGDARGVYFQLRNAEVRWQLKP